jgi:hypothetical protein
MEARRGRDAQVTDHHTQHGTRIYRRCQRLETAQTYLLFFKFFICKPVTKTLIIITHGVYEFDLDMGG